MDHFDCRLECIDGFLYILTLVRFRALNLAQFLQNKPSGALHVNHQRLVLIPNLLHATAALHLDILLKCA